MTRTGHIKAQIETKLAQYLQEDGDIGRRVGAGLLFAPDSTELDGEYIHWAIPTVPVKPQADILTQFVLLHGADDRQILEFCKKYGALTPSHAIDGETKHFGSDKLSDWRALSRNAYGLLRLAHDLHDPTPRTLDHWNTLIPPHECLLSDSSLRSLGTLEERRSWYARLQHNLDNSRNQEHLPVEHRLSERVRRLDIWTDGPKQQRREVAAILFSELGAWKCKFGSASLDLGMDLDNGACSCVELDFGASLPCYISTQLMQVIAAADIFICSACGTPYLRSRGRRAPNPGKRNYCNDDNCRIRERNRLAAQKKRTRDRTLGSGSI
jgi:hypothetical protein